MQLFENFSLFLQGRKGPYFPTNSIAHSQNKIYFGKGKKVLRIKENVIEMILIKRHPFLSYADSRDVLFVWICPTWPTEQS